MPRGQRKVNVTEAIAENNKEKINRVKAKINGIMRRDDNSAVLFTADDLDDIEIDRLPCSAFPLNLILGGSKKKGFGFPVGRFIELMGSEHSGKTVIALSTVAEAQKMGKVCAYIDYESSLDLLWAAKLGVNIDELLIASPESMEEALTVAEALVESGDIQVIVLDSIGAMVPVAIQEKGYDEETMGIHAKKLTRFVNILAPKLRKHSCTLLCINQLRDIIGSYGGGTTTPGGRAARHAHSIRLEIKRDKEMYKENKLEAGILINCSTKKNKTARPWQTCQFALHFEKGIVEEVGIVEVALMKNVIARRGAWYNFGEHQWQGKEAIIESLIENQELKEEVKNAIMEIL